MSKYNPRVVTPVQGSKLPAATGTPEALATEQTLVRFLRIRAMRSGRVANTGSVYVGFSATNDAQLEELVPSEWLTLTPPAGEYLDLATIYVDAVTLGDGVIFWAFK